MIGKLSGKIDSCFSDYAIIDISGVGYLVYCSSRTLNQLVINESYQLFIETHVREDHINLYGFLSLEEKSFFNLLQSVNGIGTRMALTILSGLSLQEIQSAIIKRDKDVFKSVSGVGLKLAERIIVELKGKMPNNVFDTGSSVINDNNFGVDGTASDAVLALMGLGVNKVEAQNLVQAIITENPDIKIDQLITLALKMRGSNV
jgi:Holliday junction DNA helicase RuvA